MKILGIIIISGMSLLWAGEDYNLYKQGKKAWYREDWEQAAVSFGDVLSKYPDSNFFKPSLYFLGSCEYKLNKYQEAFDHLSEYVIAPGSSSAYYDADEIRLLAAFELAKTKSSMKSVLHESLNHENVDLAILSASLLLQLDDRTAFEPLFKKLHEKGSPRTRQKLIDFIEENGSIDERERLRDFNIKENEPVIVAKNKMLHLVILEENNEVLNISIPLSFAEYFRDMLSEEQLISIEKEAHKDLKNLLLQADRLEKGEMLIRITDENGRTIKIDVD